MELEGDFLCSRARNQSVHFSLGRMTWSISEASKRTVVQSYDKLPPDRWKGNVRTKNGGVLSKTRTSPN
jgi:hypothetical protein